MTACPTPRRTSWRVARIVLATLAATGLLAALGAAILLRGGWYDVGAVDQHWQPTFRLLELGLRYSVRHHARAIVAPPLTAEMAQRGARIYAQHCVQCHGAPGVAAGQASLGLQPTPGPLVNMPQRWQNNELYWIVTNGAKMTGMPAWRFRLNEQDRWDVVALIAHLPRLTPAEGAAMFAAAPRDTDQDHQQSSGRPDPERGRVALSQYSCQSCHVTPGVSGARVDVGPPLKGLRDRKYVAGYLPNTRANLVRWIRFPDQVKPGTAMPALQVSDRDARDMVAWLVTDAAQ
jgi:mono/diheme cytochrome c family protein